jgi:hypothetical protein
MQRYTVYFIWKLLYIFRVVIPPIIRKANYCMPQHLLFFTPLLLSAAIVEDLERTSNSTPIVEELERSFNSSTIVVGSSNGVTNTRCCGIQ